MRRAALALFATLLVAGTAGAQAGSARVIVSDSTGKRIAFALIQVNSGTARAANDSGRLAVETDAPDSLKLTVRRMGYAPFDGMVGRDTAEQVFRVVLAPLPQALKRIAIMVPQDNRLFRNGFYSRLEASRAIATPTRFFTPEDLDARPVARTSQILQGIPFILIRHEAGKAILQGRGRCPANVLVDGRTQPGMVEEILTPEGERMIVRRAATLPASIRRENRNPIALQQLVKEMTSIDELLSAISVAAVETYASANQAPVELRNSARDPMCVLIAIWTGPRQ